MVRIKRRYFLVKIQWEQKPQRVDTKGITNRIQEEIIRHFGDLGSGFSLGQIFTIRYLDASNMFFIRVEHANKKITEQALSLVHSLFKTPCTLNPLICSGTVRKCEEMIFKSVSGNDQKKKNKK
ncbi:putative Rpp14/Pop5 family [Monocercomonoides exilis]|uniref:putative Rpp14/Pop5 family n=1 Tax=Monocercomonoides exilis TaxID=2049356 RepID=UPI0035599EEE|nr:putative Rpp14/Pop5 family [Monocercomonoides exilis]|eukprot:MONOS_4050.1-p1 / transcript=MONOS_4050.1 / gene=MONOS_4050 / organism=Monocercomonoides_exilis_PA203 / gene_product=unspecified product / transcript_product=unspecified product / location=Mono_scaffold00103:10193-10617(-) / protein_length=123 / sequence_SO=supercontig / SO=protein_coding / is_pseudo=false